MFEKILIANRGEIACRVIRTCRRLGIASVAVYSEADAAALHVRLADEAYCIGGPAPADSYLRGDAVIQAALGSGAQAIHPGYGFLSENAAFAEAVAAAGLVFIGPGAGSMRRMGSKAGAKQLMAQAGVPVVPGYNGEDQALATLSREAARTGFPLMVKAAHGGGGKGMRVVHRLEDFVPALESCQREALGAFGRDRVLLERYVSSPRHIEIQVFGDTHGNVIHLNERECSAQRRYQKVVEESPSPFLTPELRARMGAAAVQAAHAIDYINAGTVEFIVGADGDFYFMEINTRLQVEHPVTELVTGLDLVEWQLRVAAGEPLPLHPQDIEHRGHAIELRLYAEDPAAGFLPGSGRLEVLRLPAASPGVRVDAGVVEGDTVTVHYDPMIAKLIVHDVDRPAALARLREALADCEVVGPKSNLAFLEALVRHPRIVDGSIHTAYLDAHLAEVLPAEAAPPPHLLACAAVAGLLQDEARARIEAAASADPNSPWALADGWRLGQAGDRALGLLQGGQRQVLHASGHDGEYRIRGEAGEHRVRGARLADGWLDLELDGRRLRLRARASAGDLFVHDGEQRLHLQRVAPYQAEDTGAAGRGDRVQAPMPGRIVLVRATPGQTVAEGEELLVMEAMKMELSLRAPRAGLVAAVRAAVGEFVEADALLVALEPQA